MANSKSIFKKQGIFGNPSQDQPTQEVDKSNSTEPPIISNVEEKFTETEVKSNIQNDEVPMIEINSESEITNDIVQVVKDMQKGLRGLDEIKKSIPASDKLKELLDGDNLEDVNKNMFIVSNTINEIKRILQYKDMELEVLECYMSLQIRNNPVAYGLMDGKTTENSIKCVICNNVNVLTLRRTILNINYMLNGLVNILNVLKTKMRINNKVDNID